MISRERQMREHKETKNKILDTARNIIAKEGIEGLTIRKITSAIDYSPASIYHYFTDKNEIIARLVKDEYKKILTSVISVERNEESPEKEMKEIFIRYIKGALNFPELYLAFMLNSDNTILKKTALLNKGTSKKSPTLKLLTGNIQRGIEQGCYRPCDPELTAQIIWTSTFGLIVKVLIEKNISDEQIDRLTEEHFKILFNGILTKKCLCKES